MTGSHDLSKLKIPTQPANSIDSLGLGRNKKFQAVAAVIALVLVGIYLRTGQNSDISAVSSQQPSTNIHAEQKSQTGSVLGGTLTASGYVVAQRKAAVASQGTGRLAKLNVREGDAVKEGDILGEIENSELLAAVDQLTAQLAVAEARLKSVEAERLNAAAELERSKQLKAAKANSASSYDQAVARSTQAEAEVVGAKANIALAEAQLRKGKVELGYTLIKAPFDGTVLTKTADVGEIVAPFGSSSNARAALVTMADMSSLEVEADVAEANISRVHVGQKADITLDSFADRRYEGEVTKIVPTVDRAKATVMVKIKFLNRDDRVIPEMSAKVFFR